MVTELCACGTGIPFARCCEPFLKKTASPATAVALMRSRYSAFVRHDIDYLVDTVAPDRRKEVIRKGIEEWSHNSRWAGLEIIAVQQGGPEDRTGQVEFIAKYHEDQEEKAHHELATFVKVDGKWYFEDGRTPPGKPVKLAGPRIGRNDPCPCGSGKKYKKCHGQAGVSG